MAQLKRISAKQLTGQDAISYAVLLTSLELEMQINAQFGSLPFSANDAWMPVSQMSGIQMDFPALPRLFAELPRLPYGIRAMEAYEGDNAEHYTPGASDGSRAGYFEANTNNLQRTPSYAMESLVLHETVPGHHLQIARQQELKELPEFRKNGSVNAFAEGWALYAESLGNEMGFYKDPYNKFG